MVQAYATIAKKIALFCIRFQDVFCNMAAMMGLSDQAITWPSTTSLKLFPEGYSGISEGSGWRCLNLSYE